MEKSERTTVNKLSQGVNIMVQYTIDNNNDCTRDSMRSVLIYYLWNKNE